MDPSIDDIGNINISDVIEVIKTTDPGFVENNRREEQQSLNMSTVCDEAIKHMEVENSRQSVYAEIVEQPASKALRFRYECEGRSAGSIPGVNSTPENKTYPSIRIVNYNGRAVVVVSCVTKDKPYKPHPHNLVGKEACKKGVCTVEISDNMTVTFANLGIQCVKKKDIEEALRVREEIRVDPFRTRFEHKKHPTSIDLNAVRLCFQVFLEGGKGKFTVPLAPIVSDIIYDKKAMSDLVICKLSHCSASVAGGMEMMLLCEKVAKEDIHVRFFEERDNQIVWDANADFQPTQVHKQVAIAFRTPSYRSQQVDQPVQVYIQLRRPSDGTTSEPLPFQMLPLGADDPDSLKRKRPKTESRTHGNPMNQPISFNFNLVKSEPRDSMAGYSGTSAMGSSFYPPDMSSNHLHNLQNWRPALPPHRTPSPMECMSYNNPGLHPNTALQYQTSPGHVSPNFEPQLMYNNQPIMVNRHTPEQNIVFHPPLNPVNIQNNNSDIDLDSNQLLDITHMDSLKSLNSADLAVLDDALSKSFESDLLISDANRDQTVRGAPGSTAEGNNASDSFTRVANNTIQELCALNNIYP